jgi:CPA2 family monovalent cation:H+ antiporter-2
VVTTLVTPYLIRTTDPMVGWIDRVAPRPLMQGLSVYTAWVGSFMAGAPGPVVLLVRRMGWQLLVNLLLTVGIFALGAWAAQWEWPYAYLPPMMHSHGAYTLLVWFAVMLLTSGIYLASVRKIQAMSMLVAEVAVPFASGGQHSGSVRMVISQVFVLISFTVMAFLTLLLSTSIVSSVNAVIPLLGIAFGTIFLFRRILVRIYSRAELALHETLIELPRLERERPKVIHEILRDAELDTTEIPPGSIMIGRKLRDIPLRQQTGASIVAIERHGQRVINPGPDEALQQGDRVLLLGELEQLPAACELLAKQV